MHQKKIVSLLTFIVGISHGVLRMSLVSSFTDIAHIALNTIIIMVLIGFALVIWIGGETEAYLPMKTLAAGIIFGIVIG